MKGRFSIVFTASLIVIYLLGFLYYLWENNPDNSKKYIETQVNIKQNIQECNIYLSETKDSESKLVSNILKASIKSAYRVDKSRIRSKQNSDYAMYANFWVWGGTVVAPLYILLLFIFLPSDYSNERNKSIGIVIAFLAALNFVNSAYDSHGRWGFSRVSEYHKESLIDQWLYRINIGCATKKGTELVDLISKETDALLVNFAIHRNLVTENFFSLKFNKIPEPSEIISGVTK